MMITQIVTRNGIPMLVRLVRTGDRYGRELCLTHDEANPLVEFYDNRTHPLDGRNENAFGHFITRYCASTLLRTDSWSKGRQPLSETGLDLHGGMPIYAVDAGAMAKVIHWLETYTESK
jgi:hypothetical protein